MGCFNVLGSGPHSDNGYNILGEATPSPSCGAGGGRGRVLDFRPGRLVEEHVRVHCLQLPL
eukprot:11158623-Prorocentrum_lima.AAC.1